MLKFNVEKRLTARQALLHPYLTGNYKKVRHLLTFHEEV